MYSGEGNNLRCNSRILVFVSWLFGGKVKQDKHRERGRHMSLRHYHGWCIICTGCAFFLSNNMFTQSGNLIQLYISVSVAAGGEKLCFSRHEMR